MLALETDTAHERMKCARRFLSPAKHYRLWPAREAPCLPQTQQHVRHRETPTALAHAQPRTDQTLHRAAHETLASQKGSSTREEILNTETIGESDE